MNTIFGDCSGGWEVGLSGLARFSVYASPVPWHSLLISFVGLPGGSSK